MKDIQIMQFTNLEHENGVLRSPISRMFVYFKIYYSCDNDCCIVSNKSMMYG